MHQQAGDTKEHSHCTEVESMLTAADGTAAAEGDMNTTKVSNNVSAYMLPLSAVSNKVTLSA